MQLRFHDHHFRIMLVGDPHERPIGSDDDKKKTEDFLCLQYAAVRKLKPDLVVLMGDNAEGKDPSELRETLLRITEPYAVNDVPFAFILGNHDLECPVSDLKEHYGVYRTLPGCLLPPETQVSEYGDYHLTVKATEGDQDALNLWLVYSGNRAEPKYNSRYAFVKTEQLDWYREKERELREKNGAQVPAILFQHIPVPEEYDLLRRRSPLSMLYDGVVGQDNRKGAYYTKNRLNPPEGYVGESPCAPDYNNGQFAAWKETGDVFAAFFGHDHMNDFVGMTDGIILGQCKTAGFHVYGDGLQQGVRILELDDRCPRNLDTRMVRYRELVGTDCLSIQGRNKVIPDRWNVKIDVLLKALPAAGALAVPLTLAGLLHRKR